MLIVNCVDFVQLLFPNGVEGLTDSNAVLVIPFVGEVAPEPMETAGNVDVEMDVDENALKIVVASEIAVTTNVEVNASGLPVVIASEPVSNYDMVDETIREADIDFAAMEVDPTDERIPDDEEIIDVGNTEDMTLIDHEEAVPVQPHALNYVCLDVRTGVVYNIQNACDCGRSVCQQGFMHDMNSWEQQAANNDVELPENIIADPRMSDIPLLYVPTQKITWDVENNYVDYDDSALCLCGDFFCQMKFQMDIPIDCSGIFRRDIFNDYHTEAEEIRLQEMQRRYEAVEVEQTRRYISILERESKEIQQELMNPPQEGVPKSKRAIPWTLFSGIPFYLMSDEQLVDSYDEIDRLRKSARSQANFQWQQAGQFQTSEDQEISPYSLLGIFSSIAERTEAKILHYEYLQAIVVHLMDFRR